MTKQTTIAVVSVLVIVVVAGIIWWAASPHGSVTINDLSNTSSTTAISTSSSTAVASIFDRSLSDATITMSYPSDEFSLATTSSAITTKTYIPPCDGTFNDCLYYTGNDYAGTNFESAGIRVQQRTTLTTQQACLNTDPEGFNGMTPTVATSSDYAVSVFPNVGDAAAGHFSSGSLYRLYYSGTCYEYETRIGQSDYQNYPSGTIAEFTSADQSAIQATLVKILSTVTLRTGEKVIFPNI